MKNDTLGGFASIDVFVKAKLDRLNSENPDFSRLFELMFSESENVLYERSRGYKIEYTTYGEAKEAALGRASALISRFPELPAGSVVGLYGGNSVEWIELFWAILCAGFRPLLMNTRLDKETLASALSAAGAAAVVSDGAVFPVPTVLFSELDPAKSAPSRPFGGEILVMSSGTSQNVKLCAYTAAELARQIGDSAVLIRRQKLVKKHYEGRLKLLAFLPFYHVFGLIAMYFWFGFFSRTFVHLGDLRPETILGTIKRHKVTHIFAVPLFWERVYSEALKTIRSRGEKTYAKFQKGVSIYEKLSSAPALAAAFSKTAFREVRDNLFGESISFMITGGSEISRDALLFFNAIGYRLADGYGMSEIGITSVELSDDPKALVSASVGEPLSSVEYSITPEGELIVRGESLARYIIEGGERRENSGWFSTGDLAEREGGHYRILGRRDDLVVSASGENLNPNLIEPKFDIPGARGVALVSSERDCKKTAVLLVSVRGHLPEEKLRSVESAVRARVSELGLASEIGGVYLTSSELIGEDEFKLNRSRLRRDLEAGALPRAVGAAVSSGSDSDPLLSRVLEIFAAALEKDISEISPETDFFIDGGGTSLDYFAMLSRLSEEFSLQLPDGAGSQLATARAVAQYVKAGGDDADITL